MSNSRSLSIAVLFLSLAPGLVMAHGVSYRLEAGPESAVVFSYENGAPLADAKFEIFSPQNTEPIIAGRTDTDGQVMFQPDRPGLWLVKVFTEDGHGSIAEVQVNADLSWAEETPDRPNKLLKNLYGLLALASVFFIAWIMSRLKSRTEPS